MREAARSWATTQVTTLLRSGCEFDLGRTTYGNSPGFWSLVVRSLAVTTDAASVPRIMTAKCGRGRSRGSAGACV